MKVSTLGFGLIVILVIAVAFAGCTGTTQAPSGGQGPSAGGAQATAAPQGGGVQSAGSLVGADKILSGTPYNWVEYKTVTKSGGNTVTMIYKYDVKTGKCSMRIEGQGMQVSGMTMDCSASGSGQAASNPNEVKSDVKFAFVGIEPVTVPAGTYATASKYSFTSQGQTMYYWTAPGVPTFVKMSYKTPEGDMVTELNGWG